MGTGEGTLSERTSLLPAYVDPSGRDESQQRKESGIKIAAAVVVLCVTLSMSLIILSDLDNSNTGTASGSQETFPFLSDAQLAVWDAWKEKLSWLGNEAKVVEDTTTKDVGELVNLTEADAQKFAGLVSSWWDEGIQDLALPDKEAAIQKNFQTWWHSAEETEHAWWTGLVRSLKNDEQEAAAWLSQGETSAAVTLENFWNATVTAVEHESAVAVQEEEDLWAKTKDTVVHEEHVLGEDVQEWWQKTEAFVEHDIQVLEAEEALWWNATAVWFHKHLKVTPLPSLQRPLIYLNSTQAYSMITNANNWYDYSSDYFMINPDVQQNQAYCGVATSAAVMNSFSGLPTSDPVYEPYVYYTQTSLLDNECVKTKVTLELDDYDGVLKAPGGLSLNQVGDLLECHLDQSKYQVHVHHIQNVTLPKVRELLREALMSPQQRILLNYDRQGLGQVGSGHFSPVGSYNVHEDMLLIMDVAKYKYPYAWVPTSKLYLAMKSSDPCGVWDYPGVPRPVPQTQEEMKVVYKELKCQPAPRGFIVVEQL